MPAANLSPRARRDLLEAIQWITRDNPTAAEGLRTAVLNAGRRLGDHPRIGVIRPELADEPVRFLTLTGYPHVIVYDADNSPPLILRILHGARDLPELLQDLRRP